MIILQYYVDRIIMLNTWNKYIKYQLCLDFKKLLNKKIKVNIVLSCVWVQKKAIYVISLYVTPMSQLWFIAGMIRKNHLTDVSMDPQTYSAFTFPVPECLILKDI